ncbi:hypothetical protein BDR07DRAFT_1494125 [Suillus spraguei]|nr:hypothetical protein BDR07DRAFT_1494125 [Suillus spraguei]
MSSIMEDTRVPKAQWNDVEVDALLDYLISQKSKIAAIEIAGLGTHGPAKTGVQCKTKWQSLKQVYNAIDRCRNNRSGCHWDNSAGANIQGEAAEAQWAQFINSSSANKVMKPFKNSGWRSC